MQFQIQKKTIQVDFPLEKIKNSILNIPLLNKNYRFSSSNEVFNQFTFESFEFLSIGVYLDFHLNSISESKTEINLEIKRKIGSFNQPAEITNANMHGQSRHKDRSDLPQHERQGLVTRAICNS